VAPQKNKNNNNKYYHENVLLKEIIISNGYVCLLPVKTEKTEKIERKITKRMAVKCTCKGSIM
jgi:hypothetical protein